MWELDCEESWAPQNWCFWTMLLEKTLGSPLDCKEIQPVHPKRDQSGYSLEGLMLKLKLQYFGHLLWRADSFEKTLMLRKTEGERRRRRQRMRWLDGIIKYMDIGLGGLRELVTDRELQFMGSQRVGHDWATELTCSSPVFFLLLLISSLIIWVVSLVICFHRFFTCGCTLTYRHVYLF